MAAFPPGHTGADGFRADEGRGMVSAASMSSFAPHMSSHASLPHSKSFAVPRSGSRPVRDFRPYPSARADLPSPAPRTDGRSSGLARVPSMGIEVDARVGSAASFYGEGGGRPGMPPGMPPGTPGRGGYGPEHSPDGWHSHSRGRGYAGSRAGSRAGASRAGSRAGYGYPPGPGGPEYHDGGYPPAHEMGGGGGYGPSPHGGPPVGGPDGYPDDPRTPSAHPYDDGETVLSGSQAGDKVRRKMLRRNSLSAPPEEEHMDASDGDSFRTLEYTPLVNVRPVDLTDSLRVFRQEKRIRVTICITMYSENAGELQRTLQGIADGVPNMERAHVGWDEVAIFIVVDGREKCHESLLKYAEDELKLFDSSMLVTEADDKPVTMHLFERSVRLARHTSQREYYMPLQLAFCLKEKNGGKLNSHLWYFSAFCRQLQPDYTFLVDVGTVPRPESIALLFQAMENNCQVGGVCGQIAVRSPRFWHLLEAAQVFEYKVAHLMDKAMESVFGYITVLPGAFSAYRWHAILGEPLNRYFKVEENTIKEMGPFLSNMYLAEDRVLCFEVVLKKDYDWTLNFISGATADTDVPATLDELIRQRRRWLNGSLFALIYYVTRFPGASRYTAHSFLRTFFFYLQFLYQVVNIVSNWLLLGSLYLSFALMFQVGFQAMGTTGEYIIYFLAVLYFMLALLQILAGLTTSPRRATIIYHACSLGFGIYMILALSIAAWQISINSFTSYVVLAGVAALGAYLVCSLWHGELFAIVAVLPQYLFLLPTFVNMFTTYSFCNLHDISWGTKEGSVANRIALEDIAHKKEREDGHRDRARDGVAAMAAQLAAAEAKNRRLDAMNQARINMEKEKEEVGHSFNAFRTRLLGLWVVSNWIYITMVLQFRLITFYTWIIGIGIFMSLVYRVIGSFFYQFERLYKWICLAVCNTRVNFRCCTSRSRLERRMPRNKREARAEYDEEEDDYDGYHYDAWFEEPKLEGRNRAVGKGIDDVADLAFKEHREEKAAVVETVDNERARQTEKLLQKLEMQTNKKLLDIHKRHQAQLDAATSEEEKTLLVAKYGVEIEQMEKQSKDRADQIRAKADAKAAEAAEKMEALRAVETADGDIVDGEEMKAGPMGPRGSIVEVSLDEVVADAATKLPSRRSVASASSTGSHESTEDGDHMWKNSDIYTCESIARFVTTFFRGVSLDPCASVSSRRIVQPERSYRVRTDGLEKRWFGRVFCNPPRASDPGEWLEKAMLEYRRGNTEEIIILLPTMKDQPWFNSCFSLAHCWVANPMGFTNDEGGERLSKPFDYIIIYMGNRLNEFSSHFGALGRIPGHNAWCYNGYTPGF